jgi:hypothetical protein
LLWSIYTYFWPKTIGNITILKLEEVKNSDVYEEYEIIIEYSYSVKGIKYKSQNFFINGPDKISTKELATKKLEEFKLGQEIPIYFDPLFPKFSVQKQGIPQGVIMGFIIGMFMLLIAWSKFQT